MLKIENPGFQDFRTDASCTIEPQALIGEKYVNCLPTQARAEGAPLPPPLPKIPAGHEGAGDYLLPVTNTSSPVGVDLLSDIGHLSENQRLTIILNELGTGLAGRGSDLNAVLHRSNPALQQLEKVLGILASQNKVLGNLAEEGNKALEPLVRERKQFSEFFAQSSTVAAAAAATAPSWRPTCTNSRPSCERCVPTSNTSKRSPNRRPRRSPISASQRPASTRPSRTSGRSRRAPRSTSKASAPPRRRSAPRSSPPNRCSRGSSRWAARRHRLRRASPNSSPACVRPGVSSGCSTSSSWAPATSTATTRSATSSARSRSATNAPPTKSCSNRNAAPTSSPEPARRTPARRRKSARRRRA